MRRHGPAIAHCTDSEDFPCNDNLQPSVATSAFAVQDTEFGQLILRKIIIIVATRCHILKLRCTKFDFGWGSAPDPAGGAYSAPPGPLAESKGPYF